MCVPTCRESFFKFASESANNADNCDFHLISHRYESWGDCAIREVLEETGLDIHNVKFGHVTNDIMKDQQKHYITIFMMAECVPPPSFLGMAMHPKPRNLEPHKCHGWDSYSWDELCILAGNDVSDKDGATAVELFGPLLQLVKESPQTVIDFINKS